MAILSMLSDLKEVVNREGFYGLIQLIPQNNPDQVKKLFESYGYTMEGIPGVFIKYLTATREMGTIEDTLKEIEALGLREVFNANILAGNLLVGSFANVEASKRMIANIKDHLAKGMAITDQEGNLVPSIFEVVEEKKTASYGEMALDDKKMGVISLDSLKTDLLNSDNGVEKLEIFSQIISKINYCLLGKATNELLANTVQELPYKLYNRVLHEEYRFPNIYEMVSNSLNDILGSQEGSREVADMILSSIADLDEQRNGERVI